MTSSLAQKSPLTSQPTYNPSARVKLYNVALDKNDFSSAKKLEHDLMTKKFKTTGQWILGIKRLVESLEKIKNPTVARPQTTLNAGPMLNQPGAIPGIPNAVRPNTYSSVMGMQGPPTGAPPLVGPPITQPPNPRAGPPPTTGFMMPTTAPVTGPPLGLPQKVRPPTTGFSAVMPGNSAAQAPSIVSPPTSTFASMGIQNTNQPPIHTQSQISQGPVMTGPQTIQRPPGQGTSLNSTQRPDQFGQSAPSQPNRQPPPMTRPPPTNSAFSPGASSAQRPPPTFQNLPQQRPPPTFQGTQRPSANYQIPPQRPPQSNGPYGY